MRNLIVIFSIILFLSSHALAESNNSQPWSVVPTPPQNEAPAYETEEPAEEASSPKYCFPDLKKWSFSSIRDTYFLSEATIVSIKNQRYIKIWVSRLKDSYECSFEKEHVTIDCISNASGEDWYSVTPVDPDDDYYSVVKDICKAFPEKKVTTRPKKK